MITKSQTKFLFDILKRSNKKEAIHLTRLSFMTHINDRQVKEIIRGWRVEGQPISGSSSTGYYWAHSVEDLDERINTVKANIITAQATLKALLNTRYVMAMDTNYKDLFPGEK